MLPALEKRHLIGPQVPALIDEDLWVTHVTAVVGVETGRSTRLLLYQPALPHQPTVVVQKYYPRGRRLELLTFVTTATNSVHPS